MKLDLLILAIAPVATIILWIYLKDKYDKEPIRVLSKFFILGILVSILAIYAEEILIKTNIFTGKINIFYMSFIVAGVVEEGLKELVLIPNLLKEKSFNERLDGIIYSVFLPLGFATIENIIYILLTYINILWGEYYEEKITDYDCDIYFSYWKYRVC